MNVLTHIASFLVIFDSCLATLGQIAPAIVQMRDMSTANCKWPKSRNCNNAKIAFDIYNNGTVLRAKSEFKETFTKVQVKLRAVSNGRVYVRIQGPLCENMPMTIYATTLFEINDKCDILKGSYDRTLNMTKALQDFVNGQFIYGNFTYKTALYNEHCNIVCATIRISFIPKTEN